MIEYIIIPLCILILIGLVIFLTRSNKNMEKVEVLPNMPLIENDYRKEFTDGYTRGVLKSIKERKNGCSLVEFFPLDIEQREDQKQADVQSVVILNGEIKRFPKTDISERREVIKLITRDPLKIPEGMKGTPEENWIKMESQKAWILETFGRGILGGDMAIGESMKDWARGQVSANALAKMKEENKVMREMKNAMDLEKDKEK